MITTRVLDIENSNTLGQLPRRNTQASEEYWTDIGKRQCIEPAESVPLGKQERIRFNVSGAIFETFSKTLLRFPNTLLGSAEQLILFYDEENDFYFFDRNRDAFESILYFYQSYGKLIKPANLGLKLFIEELKFFKMGEEIINRFMVKFRYHENEIAQVSDEQTIRSRIWNFFEYPTSKAATAVAFFSVTIICVSVIQFCIETMPVFKTKYSKQLFEVESFCVAWFTLELLLRFLSAPSKCKFIKSLMNVIDLLSIIPFYMALLSELLPKKKEAPPFESLRVLRLARVLRVFKLSRHVAIFKILGLTIKSSFRELMLLLFFLLTAVILFSSAVYFADKSFPSIPDAFWFTIITLTNVGYGDSVPTTRPGKFIASICAVCGLIILALPIPVFVSSFMYFYNLEKENQRLEKQGRIQQKRVVATANAQDEMNATPKVYVSSNASLDQGEHGEDNTVQRAQTSPNTAPDHNENGEDIGSISELSEKSAAQTSQIQMSSI